MNGNKNSLGLPSCFAIFVLAILASLPSAAQVFESRSDKITTEQDDDLPGRNPTYSSWKAIGTGYACSVNVLSDDLFEVKMSSELGCQGDSLPFLYLCFESGYSGSHKLNEQCLSSDHSLAAKGGIYQNWMKETWIDVINLSIDGKLKLHLREASDKEYPYTIANKVLWFSPEAD